MLPFLSRATDSATYWMGFKAGLDALEKENRFASIEN